MNKNDAKKVLRNQFSQIRPNIVLTRKGYTNTIDENLINGVRRKDFECELRAGGGGELEPRNGNEPKFQAVHSSAALTVNCFAPFKRYLPDLSLLHHTNFKVFCFEARCRTGLGGMPPHLDVLLRNEEVTIGIQTKLTQLFDTHEAKFSSSYTTNRNPRWCNIWYQQMQHLQRHNKYYKYLDAAQLVKHAFGMRNTFPNHQTKLLYLYWQPTNTNQPHEFIDHQNEIKDFANQVNGGTPSFHFMSYLELWNDWDNSNTPNWLKNHIKNLRERYQITIP